MAISCNVKMQLVINLFCLFVIFEVDCHQKLPIISKIMPNSSYTTKKQSKKPLVDKVSEDTFYENLLLGFIDVLKSSLYVSDICLERQPPVTEEDIQYWEYYNGVSLPPDTKNFYMSTNGFLFTYKLKCDYGVHDMDNNCTFVGGIRINSLPTLKEIADFDIDFKAAMSLKLLAPAVKVFSLVKIDNLMEIVLIYFNPRSVPKCWLYLKAQNFYYLAEDLTTYLCMAMAHLGLPGWQVAALQGNVPEWNKEMFRILAPGVLAEDKKNLIEWGNNLNKIDPDIFGYIRSENIITTNNAVTLDKDKKGARRCKIKNK